jgi:hypothetical protein
VSCARNRASLSARAYCSGAERQAKTDISFAGS